MNFRLKPCFVGLGACVIAARDVGRHGALRDLQRFAQLQRQRRPAGRPRQPAGGSSGSIRQAHNVAEIIQRVAPDVLLINEFDLDLNGTPGAGSTPMPLGY